MDAARGLGLGLGGTLAAAGAAISTVALLVLPVVGVAVPSMPEAVFVVAVGATIGVIVTGRGPLLPRPAGS